MTFTASLFDKMAADAGLSRYGTYSDSAYGESTARYSYGNQHLIVNFVQGRYSEEVYSAKVVVAGEGSYGGSLVARPSWARKDLGDAYEARPFANFGWAMEALQNLIEQKVKDDAREVRDAKVRAIMMAKARRANRQRRAFFRSLDNRSGKVA